MNKLTLLCVSLLCFNVNAQTELPGGPLDRLPRMDLEAIPQVIEDKETEKKNLQFQVKVASKEQLFDNKSLKVSLMVIGRSKKKSEQTHLRMLLNEVKIIHLDAGEKFKFTSALIKSGEGDPEHINHEIFYVGYIVVLENEKGEVIKRITTNKKFFDRLAYVRKTKTNENFVNVITSKIAITE